MSNGSDVVVAAGCFVVVFVVFFVFLLLLWLCTAALAVGFLTVTYVTFAVLFVGLCFPRSRVV